MPAAESQNPIALFLGIRHAQPARMLNHCQRVARLNSLADQCAGDDQRRPTDAGPAMNRNRTTCCDATRHGAGDLEGAMPRFGNTPIANWEGPKLDSGSFAKVG